MSIAMSHTLATAFFTGWWQALVEDGALLPCRLLPSNTLEAYEALLHHGGCDLLLADVDPAHPLGLEVDEVESFTVAYDRLAPYSAVTDGRPAYPSLRHQVAGSLFWATARARSLAGSPTGRWRSGRSCRCTRWCSVT